MPKRKISGVIASLYNNTAVVSVENIIKHKKYGKNIKSMRKFHAHVNAPDLYNIGQQVVLIESAPISKTKKWLILSDNLEG